MQRYPVEMKENFGDLLLCLLKNYSDYDFEKMNFRSKDGSILRINKATDE